MTYTWSPSSRRSATRAAAPIVRKRAIFVAAPTEAVGGGMGRVKDYVLASRTAPASRYELVPLVTRDGRGKLGSLGLLGAAVLRLWSARLTGRAGMLHVNFGDKGSAVRKGLLVLSARAVGLPVLLHLHAVELERHYAGGGRLLRWAIRQPFKAASGVTVLGERWAGWLSRDLGVPRERIDILYNGVPVAPRVRREHGPSHDKHILFLGSLIPRKGVADLLHALAALPADAGQWHATLAGGGDLDGYRALAGELGIADRLRFAGWVDQAGARALLADADMLVLPSYEEGLPLVILEALGSGTPVITTPVGAVPEVLTDGTDVRFHAPGDRAGLAAAISELLVDDAQRQRLSDAGLAIFARLFSLDAFQRGLFDIYRRRCGVDYVAQQDATA